MVGRYSEGLRKAKIVKQIYGKLSDVCRKVFGVRKVFGKLGKEL